MIQLYRRHTVLLMEPQGAVLLHLISFSSFCHINVKMLTFFSNWSLIHTSCLFRGWLTFHNSAACSLLQLRTKQIHIFNQVNSEISCQQPPRAALDTQLKKISSDKAMSKHYFQCHLHVHVFSTCTLKNVESAPTCLYNMGGAVLTFFM